MKLRYLLAAALAAVSLGAMAVDYGNLSPKAAMLNITHEASRSANDVVPAYLTVDPDKLDRSLLDDLGVRVCLDLGGTLTVRVPVGAIAALSELPGVSYIQASQPVRQMLDVARGATGITKVNKGIDLPERYTGRGVVVGIIDSGFDYTHPAFTSADGHLRIRRVWEQGTSAGDIPVTAAETAPEPFGYGVELCTESEILAAGGDIRNNSHGTHVASLAAGRDFYYGGELDGMAADADIVLVSMTDAGASNVAISDAIAYIFNYADAVGKPCVVNLSLGAHNGPHDGTSTFDVIADQLQGPGRLIVGAAGNHAGGGFHIRQSFDSADDAPLTTLIEYRQSLSEKNAGGDIELWMSQGAQMQVSLIAYKLSSRQVVQREVVYPAATEGVAEVSVGRNIVGTLRVATEQSPLNGKGHVLISSGVTGIRNGYAVGIEVCPLTAGDVDIWADDYQVGLTSKDIPGLADPGTASTICEIGGTARSILSVGSYTTRRDYRLLGETSDRSLPETDGDISSFSNFGPTADGRVKPQVCAPGCYILGAVSSFDSSGTIQYGRNCADEGIGPCYGYMQGTSMATPIVTGIVATWLEAWPMMTPESLQDIVATSCSKDSYTGPLVEPDNHWGYGKINAFDGVLKALSYATSQGVGSVNADSADVTHIIYDGRGSLTVAFGRDTDTTVSVYTPAGVLVASQPVSVRAGDSVTLSIAGLTPGLYIVTAGGATAKIKR